MRAPTLRMRQVFEHGTHFKVQKPGGETITIAKKGLSPSTVGRLRRFAQGGEVKNFARLGEVPPNEDLGTETITPVAAPTAAEAAPVSVSAPAQAPAPDLELALPTQEAIAASKTNSGAVNNEAEQRLAKDLYGKPLQELSFEQLAALSKGPSTTSAPPAGGELELSALNATPAEIAAQTAREVTTEERARAEAAPTKTAEDRIRAEAGKAYGQARVQTLEEQAAQLRRAELIDSESKKLDAQIEQQNARIAKDRETIDNAERDLAAMRNVGSYFSRLDTASKIGTAVSLAAGAIAAGLTGGPNQAMKMYENAIEADVEKQKRDQQSLLNRLVRAGNRVDQAEEIVRSIGSRVMANKLESASSQIASAKAKEGLAQLGASLRTGAEDRIERMREARVAEARQQAALNIQRAELGMHREDQHRKDLELELRAAELGQKGQKLSAEESQAITKREEERQQRLLNVGGVEVELPRASGGEGLRKNLSNRSAAIAAVDEAMKILKDSGRLSLANPYSDARKAAQAQVKLLKEIFPKGEGFERAISLNAAQVVEEALQNPLGLSSLALNQHLTALGKVSNEFRQGRKKFVLDVTRPSERQRALEGLSALEKQEAMESGSASIRKTVEE